MGVLVQRELDGTQLVSWPLWKGVKCSPSL